jgi:hypothetical protein
VIKSFRTAKVKAGMVEKMHRSVRPLEVSR